MPTTSVQPYSGVVSALEDLAYLEAREFLRECRVAPDKLEDEARELAVSLKAPRAGTAPEPHDGTWED